MPQVTLYKPLKISKFLQALVLVNNQPRGGTVVNANHIVTSCRNVLNDDNHLLAPAAFSVRVGSIAFGEGGFTSPIIAVFPHPEFNPWTLQNDVAVLRVGVSIGCFKKKMFKHNFTIRLSILFHLARLFRHRMWLQQCSMNESLLIRPIALLLVLMLLLQVVPFVLFR